MEVSDCLCGQGRFRKVSPVRGQRCLCPGTPRRSDKQSNIHCSTKIDSDHTFASLPWGARGAVRAQVSLGWRCERSEEHTYVLQSRFDLVFILLLEKQNK